MAFFKIIKKNLCTTLLLSINLIFFIIILLTISYNFGYNRKFDNRLNNKENTKKDYSKNIFTIIKNINCDSCGLFSHYKQFLGCIFETLLKGEFPIIDMQTNLNIYNNFTYNSLENPWEFFFDQIDGYKLKDVKKNAKKIKYYTCRPTVHPERDISFYPLQLKFWQNIVKLYIPIKLEILKEASLIKNKLFNGENNILGILMRGTDFIAKKPGGHPIPQKSSIVIKDIKEMEEKYKYNYYFLVTEDENIRNEFIKEFGNKLKYYKYKENLNYNYKTKQYLQFYNVVAGNLEFAKVYLINIIMLSKCLDIVTCMTNGSMAAFLFSEGFRNTKVYNLGTY